MMLVCPRHVAGISLLLSLVGVCCHPSSSLNVDFPQEYSVVTTRDIASKYSSTWHILKKGSQRLEGDQVQLRVLIHDEAEMTQLEQLQALGSVLSYTFKNTQNQDNQRNLQSISSFKELSCYRAVDETYDSMEALAKEYPDFVTVSNIGESWLKQAGQGGHDIRVMILSAPSGLTKKDNMMVVGGHHSRELPPPETIMRWADHLLQNYGNNADISWILNRTNIHLVPLANPDGREIVQEHLDWEYRKNAHPYGCGFVEQEGVDLNRNYPMWWGDDTGSSNDPCSPAYRSESPMSEPETIAIYQYASGLFDSDMKRGTAFQAESRATEACPEDASGIFIDIHSFGDFVYFPWGYDDVPSPNHPSLLTLAAKLARPGNYTLWGPGQDGFLYYVSGDVTDTMYGMDCVAAVGYEVGTAFYASCEELESKIVPVMMESLLYAAKSVSAPYTIPMGPDIVRIDVDITDPSQTKVTVNVSDQALIVPHANFAAERAAGILSVQVYLDQHPHQVNSEGWIMDAKDGLLASSEEVATYTIATPDLQGRHTLYFLATDRDGNDGPVSAVFVDYPEQETSPPETEAPTGQDGVILDGGPPPVLSAQENETGANADNGKVDTEKDSEATADNQEAGDGSSAAQVSIYLAGVATIGMLLV